MFNITSPIRHTYYKVDTPVFSGPLDLLLHLIERAELDITRIALAQVTDQFLAYIRNMSESTAEDVSAFVVVAAKLLQIKSEFLLPRPPIREHGEEDPGDSLARQLIFFKRFKEVANGLGVRDTVGLRSFIRIAPAPKIEPVLDFIGITVDDLYLAAQSVFSRIGEGHMLDEVVPPAKITIREKISLITNHLRSNFRGSFSQLIKNRSLRLDIVVTFLALLELIKRHLVIVAQEQTFGEIEIEPAGTLDQEIDFDLEFGE